VFEAAVKVLRPLSRCKAAIEVSRLLSRFRGRCRSVEAGVEVEAAIEVSRPLSRFRGRCRSGLRLLSRLSDWRGQVTSEVKAAVEVEVKAVEVKAVDVKALSIVIIM
jgi:hypothetical protein